MPLFPLFLISEGDARYSSNKKKNLSRIWEKNAQAKKREMKPEIRSSDRAAEAAHNGLTNNRTNERTTHISKECARDFSWSVKEATRGGRVPKKEQSTLYIA